MNADHQVVGLHVVDILVNQVTNSFSFVNFCCWPVCKCIFNKLNVNHFMQLLNKLQSGNIYVA